MLKPTCSVVLLVGLCQALGDESDDPADEQWVTCKVGTNEHGYQEVLCNMTQNAAPLVKFEATYVVERRCTRATSLFWYSAAQWLPKTSAL